MIILAVAGVVAIPATALAAGGGSLPDWIEQMIEQAPPAMQQHMRSPEMQQMLRDPAMQRKMASPEMREMMTSPETDQMMSGSSSMNGMMGAGPSGRR